LPDLTRRSCPECAQLVVEQENCVAICPGCGADVPPAAIVVEINEEEHREALELAIETVAAAEVVGTEEWNLGEPMHRVFAVALRSPHRVPAATMFRSSRWVFGFGVATHFIALLGLTLLLGSVISDPAFKERMAEAYNAQTSQRVALRSPGQQRLDEAQSWLCASATLTPQQRVFCALDQAATSASSAPPRRAARPPFDLDETAALLRPSELGFWFALGVQAVVLFALFGVAPLALLILLQGGVAPWSSALRVTAFAAPVWALCCVIGGAVALVAGLTPIAFYAVLGGMGWYLATVRGHLVRVANLSAPRAFGVTSFLAIFYLLFLIRIAAVGGVA
jgi:hypothetical protein